MLNRTARSVGALGLCVAVTGCSAFVPWKEQVRIETTPAGVPVYVDGVNVGPSPVTLDLPRNKSHTIVAATQGSFYRRDLNPDFSVTGTLDMVGGALLLVPGLGVLFPGAYDLDSHVVMHLDERPAYMTPATRPSDTAGHVVVTPATAADAGR